MKQTLQFLLLFLSIQLQGQGLIVNEISNGNSGSQEYIELVVIGSAANPLDAVDLTGWIIDDNNGDFTGLTTGVGIAAGHLRFAGSCLTNVTPGTIILIYNDADVNPSITGAGLVPDLNDANGDCIYVLPASSSCLESCSSLPTTLGGTPSSAYGPCSYGLGNWFDMNFANNGDVAQVRMPNTSFFHGFAYGTPIVAPFPSFPASIGGGTAFNIQIGSGGGRNYIFNSGSFTAAANFTRGTAPANETPGTPNNDANRYFLNAVRAGTYNYANLSDLSNTGTNPVLNSCTTLPIYLSRFEATKSNKQVLLEWDLEASTNPTFTFEIERSSDAIRFSKIGELDGFDYQHNYDFLDEDPNFDNYYRLKMLDPDGSYLYSKVIYVGFGKFNANTLTVFPVPMNDRIVLSLTTGLGEDAMVQIVDMLGSVVQTNILTANSKYLELEVSHLPKGAYSLIFKTEEAVITRRLVK